jgi:hypothetical protein
MGILAVIYVSDWVNNEVRLDAGAIFGNRTFV